MRLYHETPGENVAAILRDGFRDGGPFHTLSGDIYGVCVADEPPRFGRGWTLLSVEADLTDDELAAYAYNTRVWRPHGNHYREWCVPARRLNECHTTTLATEILSPPRVTRPCA
jgi:hypothetical protein